MALLADNRTTELVFDGLNGSNVVPHLQYASKHVEAQVLRRFQALTIMHSTVVPDESLMALLKRMANVTRLDLLQGGCVSTQGQLVVLYV